MLAGVIGHVSVARNLRCVMWLDGGDLTAIGPGLGYYLHTRTSTGRWPVVVANTCKQDKRKEILRSFFLP